MKKNIYWLLAGAFIFTLWLGWNSAVAQGESFLGTQDKEIASDIEYGKVKIKKFPFAVQCWTFRKFTFFETLDKVKDLGINYIEAYPGQKLGDEWKDARFDHNLSSDLIQKIREKLNEKGITLVSYGVVGFENNEERMEKVFQFARKMGIRTIVTEPAYDDFSLLEKMVKKYNINVGIHNHPEPSKYARPETVLSQVQGLDSRIGAHADTGHWMRTGVRPVEALKLLRGRITGAHLKDLNVFGDKKAYDVPFGSGEANIHDILAELSLQDFNGFLIIEHENPAEIDNPSPSIRKGIEYIESITYYQDYEQILSSWMGLYSKHGWNHYGPGYFELDERSGILKSQGGMGLFWYSVKEYRDFILEVDFKCSREDTNSGIFLRVPEVPVNNDYIYHSFEIQIYDKGEGIHKTGSVYDAEASMHDAFKPTGEWNHFKITFKENRIIVELNDILVLNWTAEPRGKVKDFAKEGYIGLQNHDSISPVYFKNVYLKELK